MRALLFFGFSKEAMLAWLSGLCIALAVGLFLRSIWLGQSKPFLWAWLARALVCVVAFLSQLAKGATYSLALSGTQVVGVMLIVALLVGRRVPHGKLSQLDRIALVTVAAGVAVWQVSGNALYGVLGAIAADGSATVMGVRAAFVYGRRESLAFWLISLGAASAASLASMHAPVAVRLAPLFSSVNALVNIATILFVKRHVRRRAERLSVDVELADR